MREDVRRVVVVVLVLLVPLAPPLELRAPELVVLAAGPVVFRLAELAFLPPAARVPLLPAVLRLVLEDAPVLRLLVLLAAIESSF